MNSQLHKELIIRIDKIWFVLVLVLFEINLSLPVYSQSDATNQLTSQNRTELISLISEWKTASDFLEKAKSQNELQLLMNPVWHVHNSVLPKEKNVMSFSMLLNLVETTNADSKKLLWKFVKKYKKDISEQENPIFDKLVGYAIKFYNDFIKLQKKYKKPNSKEKVALEALVKTLDKCDDKMTPEDIQTLIYSTGKENGYSENLRDWFKLIYEVVFGDENGPRMGFFISFFGVKETQNLIKEKIM